MSKSVDPHLDKAEAYINLNKYDEGNVFLFTLHDIACPQKLVFHLEVMSVSP